MKNEEYQNGRKRRKYGIWNRARKCFQFSICADTPREAREQLKAKIGRDAYSMRFEPRALPKNTVHSGIGPCGLCAFFPPSSGDGKPCTTCPALPRR